MVIIELMRRVVGLARGATAEVVVPATEIVVSRSSAVPETPWCAPGVDQTGVGTLVVRRGHPPDPA